MFKKITVLSPDEDTQFFEQRRNLFMLWIEKAIQAADVEAGAFIQVSRGRSKYSQSTAKFTIYAPNGDTYTNLDGEQRCHSTVCTLRAASWAEAIEKANAVFPAKFETFKRRLADGTLKEASKGDTLFYLGARSRGLAQ